MLRFLADENFDRLIEWCLSANKELIEVDWRGIASRRLSEGFRGHPITSGIWLGSRIEYDVPRTRDELTAEDSAPEDAKVGAERVYERWVTGPRRGQTR
jgi:hypothetical protein